MIGYQREMWRATTQGIAGRIPPVALCLTYVLQVNGALGVIQEYHCIHYLNLLLQDPCEELLILCDMAKNTEYLLFCSSWDNEETSIIAKITAEMAKGTCRKMWWISWK